MAVKFFGQYLLEKGIISREALLDALEYQKSINLPLGALALERKLLTAEQVRQINDEQMRTDKKFGEVAVERNFLTKAQLDDLLKTQAQRWVFLGEALVKKNHLTPKELDAALKAYKKEQEMDEQVVRTDLAAIPESLLVETTLDVSIKMFLRLAREVVKVTSVKKEEMPGNHDYLIGQEIKGDKHFVVALGVPTRLLLSMASAMIKKPQNEVNDLVMEAGKEFVNIVVGNICARMSQEELKLQPAPPEVMEDMSLVEGASACVVSRMVSTGGDLSIGVHLFDS